MANNVVLGDLSLYNGQTSLRFNGVNDRCTFPVLGVGSNFTIDTEIIPYDVTSNGFIFHPRSEMDYYLRVTGGNIVMSSWSGSSNNVIISTGIQIGVKYSISCTINGTNLTATVNGTQTVSTLPIANVTSDINMIGSQDGTKNNFEGVICCVKITTSTTVADYISNSNFGNVALVDNSGNGNDGTVIGAQWWKEEVDEVYATPQLYKSTLVSPLTEDQNVVYTDATPVYDSDDVFWNPYNQDVTYDFTVTNQVSTGSTTYNYTYSYGY